jgi:DNA-binding beta-propeller fold protein YncE
MSAQIATLLSLGALALAALPSPAAHAADSAPLTLVSRTELPGYSGDFDHFGVDLKGDRLFLAAEDHGTLEVFKLSTGEHLKTVMGVETPHSILFMPEQNRLLVTDTGAGMTKILDATTYAVLGSIKLTPGADSVGWDAPRGRLYVVTGGKDVDMKDCFVEEIDPVTGQEFSKVHFDSNHAEAMAVEQNGDRIFINITDKNYLAVIDKRTAAVIARWPVKEAEQNAPIAMDETHHRLFVVTRKPGKLVVLNADTGATIDSFKAPERTDEVVFDKANGRVYVLGGEGYIGVFQENDPDHYSELARVPSGVAAKTGVLVPELNRLFVAVSPGEAKTGAAVLQYAVGPKS